MFCSSCGKNIDDGAAFCNHCGATTGASESAAPPAQNYTQPQPFQQYSSVDPAQPQYQQTFFAGQQASVGTSGQVQFKGGKKKKTGCLIAVIAVVLIGILGIVGIALLGNSSEIKNLQMAAGVDQDTNLPIVATSTFNTWTPEIDCTFESNVEPGTVFTAEWWYLEDIANPEFITDYDVMVEEKGDQVSFGLTKPDNDWPTGKYEVRIFIGEKQIETAKFTVVE